MPESPTPQQDESIADLQAQLAALKQEHIRLHSRLQACERQHKRCPLKPSKLLTLPMPYVICCTK